MLTVFTWLSVVTPNPLLMVPNGDDQLGLASTNLPQRVFSAQQVLCTNLSGLVTGDLFKNHFINRRGASDKHLDSKLPWGLHVSTAQLWFNSKACAQLPVWFFYIQVHNFAISRSDGGSNLPANSVWFPNA
mmetsp:Transcript_75411/g.125729  ORF Transcript_75411/g.125729 Transcript_75411/m.125729 type:complete len:131 (-) Transcript_75411:84-476(-)